MEKKYSLKNAGFPQIKYCITKEEKIEETSKNKKERFFQSNIVHNINIRQLLSDNNKKIILTPSDNDELEVVSTYVRN